MRLVSGTLADEAAPARRSVPGSSRDEPVLHATAPWFEDELSGDDGIDAVLSLASWADPRAAGTTITYSFPGAGSVWVDGYGTELIDWAPLTEAQKAAARAAFAAWEAVCDIDLVEVADDATGSGVIRVARSGEPITAYAYLPGDREIDGDIWLGFGMFGDDADVSPGSYGFLTLIHEIGHALGLKHPHEADGSQVVLPAREDWFGATVMSYRAVPGGSLTEWFNGDFYPTTPMPLDIAAVGYLYGAEAGERTGADVYAWEPGERLFATLHDTGGIDRIDWSARSDPAWIDLAPGARSRLGEPYRVVLGLGAGSETRSIAETLVLSAETVIEQAVGGSANDRILGNLVANRLRGLGGDDEILGGDGEDRLDGGSGDDRLRGGSDDDDLRGEGGSDRLRGDGADDALRGGAGEDVLIGGPGEDLLIGGPLDDVLRGGADGDTLRGGGGDDLLAGGGGDDRLDGGAGRDTAVLGGPRSAYLVDGERITGLGARASDGTDELVGIEFVRFSDALVPVTPVAV